MVSVTDDDSAENISNQFFMIFYYQLGTKYIISDEIILPVTIKI